MKVSRDFTNIINWILDNLIPPLVRDSKFFMFLPFFILFKNKWIKFVDFKNEVVVNKSVAISSYYRDLSDVHIERKTDLNTKSVDYIINNTYGPSVLDIACGKGFLTKKIHEKLACKVVGIDFNISNELCDNEGLQFIEGDILEIPFSDNFFDTVICAHTLEHVLDIHKAISELRRVCKGQLIIALPRQREYLLTFDLHLHFFPYKYSILRLMNNSEGKCYRLGNDWVYSEMIS